METLVMFTRGQETRSCFLNIRVHNLGVKKLSFSMRSGAEWMTDTLPPLLDDNGDIPMPSYVVPTDS